MTNLKQLSVPSTRANRARAWRAGGESGFGGEARARAWRAAKANAIASTNPSPGVGRQDKNKDPIGFAGGDTNVYAYVGNDPVNWVDQTGLDVCLVRSEVDYHHEWIEVGQADVRSYGFWPTTSLLGGPGVVHTPDRKEEQHLPVESRQCFTATPIEDAELEAWIRKTFTPGMRLPHHRYFLGVSDCRHFAAEAMRQLKAIQRKPESWTTKVAALLDAWW